MTFTTPPPAQKSRRRRRGPSLLGWAVRAAALVLAFGAGVAVGQALEDEPPPAEPVTTISTIRPWTQTTP